MTDLAQVSRPIAHTVLRQADPDGAAGQCLLDYDGRFLRRRVLTTTCGLSFQVDLEHTTSVDAGDAFALGDGRLITVTAASEPLFEVRGADLTRLAWHIGNRHTPCEIADDHLRIRRDHVMQRMLAQLGAEVLEVEAPFTPEGGAYGHGRTHAHDHGHSHP